MNFDAVEQAKDYLLGKIGSAPEVGIVMGSGLSAGDDFLRDAMPIHYATIPHFPLPKVPGHRGRVLSGKAGRRSAIVFEGRVHYYEGHTMAEVAFCTRVIGRLGAKTILLTNAAGGINERFARGHLMLIADHINLMGANPLSGPNEDRWGPRFIDLTEVYDSKIRERLQEAGQDCGIHLNSGVYAALPGPNYETPAEIRFLRTIGADAVGMSTVPEAIAARHMGMKVGGVSMLANIAAGLTNKPINHEEVLETATRANADLGRLLRRFTEIYEP